MPPQLLFPRDDNGVPYEGGNYTHFSSNNSMAIKTGKGFLHRVTVGKTGSADWNLTLYDGIDATGAVIAVLGLNVEGSYEYDIVFQTGLYAVTSGTTPGDLTISSI